MALSRVFLRSGSKFIKHPFLMANSSISTSPINRAFSRQAQEWTSKFTGGKISPFETMASAGIISGFLAGSVLTSMYFKRDLMELPDIKNLNKIIVLTALCAEKDDQEGKDPIAKANADLESAIQEVNAKTLTAVDEAIKAIDEARTIACSYIQKGYSAIEQDPVHLCDYEKVWCELHKISLERCKVMREAMKKRLIAEEYMRRLDDLIKKARCCPATQGNSLIRIGADTVECLNNKLGAAVQKLECIKGDSCLIQAFKPILADFKNQLKDERKKERSDCGCDKGKQSELCCGDMIDEAYRKVLMYHKDVIYIAAVKNAL